MDYFMRDNLKNLRKVRSQINSELENANDNKKASLTSQLSSIENEIQQIRVYLNRPVRLPNTVGVAMSIGLQKLRLSNE